MWDTERKSDNIVGGIFFLSNIISSLLPFAWINICSSVLVLGWHCCDTRNQMILRLTMASKKLILGYDYLLKSVVSQTHRFNTFFKIHTGSHGSLLIFNPECHHSRPCYSIKNIGTPLTKNKTSKFFVKCSLYQVPYLTQ